jgi:hypothetical protein
MRVLGLVLAGGLVATASMSAHAVPLGSDAERLATVAAPGIVQAWDGCGWGWHPVPGHWSQRRGDGFRRIVRRTATTGAGTLMRVGKAPLKDGVITAAGEARTGVGVGPTAHNLRGDGNLGDRPGSLVRRQHEPAAGYKCAAAQELKTVAAGAMFTKDIFFGMNILSLASP